MPDGLLKQHPDDATRQVANLPSPRVQAHAANLMVLGDSSLACVWFGGSMEGRSDISVFMSRLAPGAQQWSEPVQLSHDAERSEQNPVLFPAPMARCGCCTRPSNRVTRTPPWCACAALPTMGTPGLIPKPWPTPPAGTFVRQPIHVHHDGSWLLPVFYCRAEAGQAWDGSHDDSGVLRSTDQGRTWQRISVPGSLGCVHMNIVPAANGQSLLAFFRSRWADHIYRTQSDDGGRTWQTPQPTQLPNNNSSVQALRLADGRLAMIFNASSAANATERRESLYDELEDTGEGSQGATVAAPAARKAFWGAPRAPMTLALSADDGLTWPWQRNLEVGDGWCMSNDSEQGRNREYSYPSLRQDADGTLHLAYTVFRQHIRHVRLQPDWATQHP